MAATCYKGDETFAINPSMIPIDIYWCQIKKCFSWRRKRKRKRNSVGLYLRVALWWDECTKMTPCSLSGSWASCYL